MLRLASSSATRAQLLRDADIPFLQQSVEFDEESIVAKDAKKFVYQATLGKYEANIKAFGVEDYGLLVADTVVTSNGRILRKAKSKEDAREILLAQSSSVTTIITCMIYHSKEMKIIDISSTDYLFEAFDLEEMEQYLRGDDWRGKAGACMVEGFCKRYIKSVRGYESTAMGLNIEILKRFL